MACASAGFGDDDALVVLGGMGAHLGAGGDKPAPDPGGVLAARDAAADAGLQVLFARGAELEQDFGYGVVRQLFEPVLATATPAERADLLAGPAAFAERLFDESQLAAALNAGEDVSFAMLHGLYWLAANVGARTPTLR